MHRIKKTTPGQHAYRSLLQDYEQIDVRVRACLAAGHGSIEDYGYDLILQHFRGLFCIAFRQGMQTGVQLGLRKWHIIIYAAELYIYSDGLDL